MRVGPVLKPRRGSWSKDYPAFPMTGKRGRPATRCPDCRSRLRVAS